MTEGMEIPRDWTFERSDIARSFDRHVREQLPWYDLVTGAVAHVARHYIPRDGLVYDIGASTGNIGRAIAPVLVSREASLVAIEASADMAAVYDGPGAVVIADAVDYPYEPFDLAVLFLVLMFIPVRLRSGLVARLTELCRPGGAIVVFDRCEAGAGYSATVMWRLALAGKVASGTPASDVVAKELSLGGVQRPLDVRDLGGRALEWFRFGDFAGYLIEAPRV